MSFDLIPYHQVQIAVLLSGASPITTAQEAAELLMNARYAGAEHVILTMEQLDPAFFDLSTGLAGGILQKFSTYGGYLAIVGDFSSFTSKSLHRFIYESNQQGRIHFVATMDEAYAALSR